MILFYFEILLFINLFHDFILIQLINKFALKNWLEAL